jgi:deazaflavin-dependent oxidoreductase (nitroreductase family)
MLIRLTTTGRATGRPREVTLYAFPDGDSLVITGSWGGAPRDPAWAMNLRAHPDASVRSGRSEKLVRAIEATGAERERLWRLVRERFPMYATFQRRTSRAFPIFVLEPRPGAKVR